MPVCKNCDTPYSNDDGCCRWCERRREELLERLGVDAKATGFETIASWAMFGKIEAPERCWRVG